MDGDAWPAPGLIAWDACGGLVARVAPGQRSARRRLHPDLYPETGHNKVFTVNLLSAGYCYVRDPCKTVFAWGCAKWEPMLHVVAIHATPKSLSSVNVWIL